jgi:SH3-like domain-containing protein
VKQRNFDKLDGRASPRARELETGDRVRIDCRKIQGQGQQLECMRNIDKGAGILASVRAQGCVLVRICSAACSGWVTRTLILFFCVSCAFAPLSARSSKKHEQFGLGFSIEVPAPESEVLQAVETVVSDGIIQGSFEYSKDKYVENANSVGSSSLFPEWKEPGTVFYKVRTKVLAPANFEDTSDEGTLAVRYVVQSRDASRTIVRIDAVFVEDSRRTLHASDGSVENAEFKDIQDHVDALELQKTEARQSEKHRQEELAHQALQHKREEDEAVALAEAQTSVEALQKHVEDLRRQAERVIKAPGGQLKSAPFHTASNLKSLDAGTEVVIVIATPYWFGIETEDGQHGWIHRDELEPLP